MKEHLAKTEFTEFQQQTLMRFDAIDKAIDNVRKIAEHQDPSPKTMAMFDQLDRRNERIERVLFGDTDNIGMQKMVKDIHDRAVGKEGFWKQVFFIGKVASVVTVVVTVIGLTVSGIVHLIQIRKF